MEQILDQAEGAEPAADKTPQQGAENHEKSNDIKRKTIIFAGDDSLQGTNGT